MSCLDDYFPDPKCKLVYTLVLQDPSDFVYFGKGFRAYIPPEKA